MSKVTPDTVRDAATRLQQRGERTSVRNLRLELGGGSPNAILEIWREVSAELADDSDIEFNVPDAVLTAVKKAMREAGAQATMEARKTIEDLEGTQAELNREIRELFGTLEKQQQAIDKLRAERGEAKTRIAKLESRCEQLVASKTDALDRLEAQRQEERARSDALADKLFEAEKRVAVAEARAQAESEKAEKADLRESTTSFLLESANRELEKARKNHD